MKSSNCCMNKIISFLGPFFILSTLFILSVQGVNNVGHLVKYDKDKMLNYTDLDFDTIVTKEVLFYCKLFQTDFDPEVHVVEFSAISKTNFNRDIYVHEMGVRLCELPRPKTINSPEGIDCTRLGKSDAEELMEYETCLVPHIILKVMATKNNGTLPEDWGFKLGSLYTSHVMLYTHIKLTDRKYFGKIINLGIRLWHTTHLRKRDMGLMIAGPTLSGYGVFVPPKQKSFVIAGHCNSDCFIKTVADGIHVKAVMGHFHQFGHNFCVGQRVRHYSRNLRKEMKVIYSAEHTDLMRGIKPQLMHSHIRSGDQITVECTFNTMNTTVAMAHSMNDDLLQGMCYAYLYYYPRLEPGIQVCGSIQPKEVIEKAVDVNDIDYYNNNFVPIIKSPSELRGQRLVQYIRSKRTFRPEVESILRYSNQIWVCNPKSEWPPDRSKRISYPAEEKDLSTHNECNFTILSMILSFTMLWLIDCY